MKKVFAAFADNTVFANIVLLMIFMAGGMGLFSMVRESFPQFSTDLISIGVVYPGADPEDGRKRQAVSPRYPNASPVSADVGP